MSSSGQKKTSAKKVTKKQEILKLVGLLAVVVVCSLAFMLAIGGLNGKKVVIDSEYHCEGECQNYMLDLTKEKYEDLINQKKSFVVLIDQTGCKTADHLKEYLLEWAKENKVMVYKMMFSEMKETSLHDDVKYYPSVAIVSEGKVEGFLRADADEDAGAYNNMDEFKSWIGMYFD